MPRLRSPVFLLCAAAYFADTALYLTMTGAPYKALALGAGPLILGLLPAARGLPYALTTIWAGGRTEGRERLRSARVSLALAAAAALLIAFVPGKGWIFLLLAVVGASLAFFWPAVQATLADIAAGSVVTANLGWFNIAWSLGKGSGFLLGGLLLAGFGFPAVFAFSAASLLAVLWLVTRPEVAGVPPAGRAAASGAAAGPPVPPAHARFRIASWIGNSLAFGIGAVLNHHYPNWLEVIGRGEALFGTYLGLTFFAQTAVFAVMTRFSGWRYRRWPLFAFQAPLVGVPALLPLLRSPAAILATAIPIGMGLGVVYFSSLFYSVSGLRNRGRFAGVHEALLGLGSLLVPFLGGVAADATGALWAPYVLAGGIGLLSLAVQATLLFRPPGGMTQAARSSGFPDTPANGG